MNSIKAQENLIRAEYAQPTNDDGPALPALSCDIEAGKLVCLMGLRHSTLLPYMQILAGIELPESGQITLLGSKSSSLSPQQRQQLHLKIGFILQGGPLLSVLNGMENLKLAARYHQLGDEAYIEEKAGLLLSELSYEADQQLLPAYMSKLQRRHLAIARHLMLSPQVLFIDSPFDGLDYHDRNIIADYLVNIVKHKQITVVVCSVDLFFANRHADQIIFCDNQETLVFDNWRSFYRCQQENIRQLFKHEHISKDDRQ